MLADEGYDSRALVAHTEAAGVQAVIPPRSGQPSRPFDAKLYRARNAIERGLGRLEPFRRIATHHDRKAAHFMAFLGLAASLAWLTD